MDLAHAVKTGRFRANLYYRLNVLPVAIPALHERREDIRRLAEHFITRFHDGYGKKTLGLSDRAMEACMHYSWQGNIRELENVMNLPIALPEGWSAEADDTFGVIITALGPDGNKGFVTVSESKRSFELGMSVVRQRKYYSGRYWRKELYEEAVATLQASMS